MHKHVDMCFENTNALIYIYIYFILNFSVCLYIDISGFFFDLCNVKYLNIRSWVCSATLH